MDKVYITGHRNPDTDSIVSAMAYAALKNALGQRQYCAARLGQISDETKAVLDKFGAQPPEVINNVRTQVRDFFRGKWRVESVAGLPVVRCRGEACLARRNACSSH